MLTVTLNREAGLLNIQSAYSYGKRIKMLPNAMWNRELKVWQLPLKNLYFLQKDFKGEIFYKTPLWEILGQPAPDVIADYELDKRIEVPEMKLPLYPYQQYGAKFMIDRISQHGFVINADGCGLGKTPQTIATMAWFAKNRKIHRILLVVKKSIKLQWLDEVQKFSSFSDGYELIATGDTKKKRDKAYAAAKAADKFILVTNYHNFLNDTNTMLDIGFDFAVIDEAHCVKSKDGKMNGNIAKVIRNLPTVFLTGTPVMSRPGDIFGIISMADPYYFDKYTALDDQWKTFKAKYIVTEWAFGHENVIGARNLDELREKCQEVTIRRTITEVAVSMPEVSEKNIKIEPDEVQMRMIGLSHTHEKDLQDEYTSFENRMDDYSVEQKYKLNVLMKGMISIKQVLSTDPAISRLSKSKMVKPYLEELPENYKSSPKTEAILDTVSEIIDSGEKVILFSKFRTVAGYIADKITTGLKCNALMYTGTEDQDIRQHNINLFRNSDEYNVLVGTDAMAEGLNLEQARHVINIDLPDTYAIYLQRVGRARRVSSKYSNVMIYNFITIGGHDENRLANLSKNKNLDEAMIAADNAQSAALAKVSNE